MSCHCLWLWFTNAWSLDRSWWKSEAMSFHKLLQQVLLFYCAEETPVLPWFYCYLEAVTLPFCIPYTFMSCFVYSRNIGSLSVVQYLARKGIKWSDEEFVRISELTRCWGSRHKSSNIPFPIIQGGQNGPVIMLIHTNCVSQERKDGRRSRKFVWPRNQNPFSREIQGGGEGEMHLWS